MFFAVLARSHVWRTRRDRRCRSEKTCEFGPMLLGVFFCQQRVRAIACRELLKVCSWLKRVFVAKATATV